MMNVSAPATRRFRSWHRASSPLKKGSGPFGNTEISMFCTGVRGPDPFFNGLLGVGHVFPELFCGVLRPTLGDFMAWRPYSAGATLLAIVGLVACVAAGQEEKKDSKNKNEEFWFV